MRGPKPGVRSAGGGRRMLLFVIVERNEGGRDDAADGAPRSRDGGRGGIDAVGRGVLLQVDGDVESKQTK